MTALPTIVMPAQAGIQYAVTSREPLRPAFTGSSAFADDDDCANDANRTSLHHRRCLPEQQLALFLGADRGVAEIRIVLLGHGVGAHRGEALADGLEPALQMREVVDVLLLVL